MSDREQATNLRRSRARLELDALRSLLEQMSEARDHVGVGLLWEGLDHLRISTETVMADLDDPQGIL